MKNSYKFYKNFECEYYPCHELDEMNCLFCFCPLYFLDDCGGNYTYTKSGIKNCINCTLPHIPETGYNYIMEKLKKNPQKK